MSRKYREAGQSRNKVAFPQAQPFDKLRMTKKGDCSRCENVFLILRPMMMKEQHSTSYSEETDLLTETEDPCQLIVWNDEVNTFDWVIETLMEVCGHTHEQAEQCAFIIHFKGKYAVKNGSYDDLKPLCDAITERGIGATVEVPA